MEVWKDVVGYEGYYQVSNLGRVKSLKRKHMRTTKILKNNVSKRGYQRVILCKNNAEKHKSIHRLVALTFILNPENKRTVNHINGFKTDNQVINLEWATSKENMQHAYDNGLITGLKGEKHNCAKLTGNDVRQIRELVSYKSKVSVAKIFNVTVGTISHISLYRTWKHI